VVSVHDLHIWTLSSGQIALSAHLDVENPTAWPRILKQERVLLGEHFNIGHVTLQPEWRLWPADIPSEAGAST